METTTAKTYSTTADKKLFIDRKVGIIIIIAVAFLILVFVVSYFLSSSKGNNDAINTSLPITPAVSSHVQDSLDNDKRRMYEEAKRLQEEKERQAASINLTTPNENRQQVNTPYSYPNNNMGTNNQVSTEPTLQQQMEEAKRTFYATDNGFGEPATTSVSPQPEAAGSQSTYAATTEQQTPATFSTVEFDQKGRPILKNPDGSIVRNSSNSNSSKEVVGNVLQASGGDVYADKQNIGGIFVHTQDVYSGSLVTLRLQEAITVNGIDIPKNSIVTGRAVINKSRIEVSVPSVFVRGTIYDVGFQLYDQDGVIGLRIPDKVSIRQINNENLRTNVQQNLAQSVSEQSQVSGQDPASGTTVISKVGNTITGILSNRRSKPLKVIVPGGYKVILRPYCENCR